MPPVMLSSPRKVTLWVASKCVAWHAPRGELVVHVLIEIERSVFDEAHGTDGGDEFRQRCRLIPDRTTGVPSRIAKDVAQQTTRTVRDPRLFGESRITRHVHRHPDDACDHIEIAGQIGYGCEAIERGNLGASDRVVDGDLDAHLADGVHGAVHQRQLAGGVNQVGKPHGRHVRRKRSGDRGQAQSKITEPL